MHGMSSELSLIKKATSGDKNALEKLLQNNYQIVKGYLLKLTCNASLTDDLTQETMYKAIANLNKYKPTGKFSTWLITIANNLYRDYLRKTKRETPLDDKFLLKEMNVTTYEEIVKVLELQNIFSELPYEKRAAVILKHYYEYSYQEIADILQCPVGTVRSRLHYSLDYIKNKIDKEDDG